MWPRFLFHDYYRWTSFIITKNFRIKSICSVGTVNFNLIGSLSFCQPDITGISTNMHIKKPGLWEVNFLNSLEELQYYRKNSTWPKHEGSTMDVHQNRFQANYIQKRIVKRVLKQWEKETQTELQPFHTKAQYANKKIIKYIFFFQFRMDVPVSKGSELVCCGTYTFRRRQSSLLLCTRPGKDSKA
jgi:hypothetical protein